jgi:hypothetical protein
MREIIASTRVTGKRRIASIDAAKRKVRDGSLYLIRRHGGYFRPEAHGYTTDLAAAGVFDGQTARGYLDVEGLSVVPVKSVIRRVKADIIEAEHNAQTLRDMLAMFEATR